VVVVGVAVAAVSSAGLPHAAAMSANAHRSGSFLIMNILRISGMKRDRRSLSATRTSNPSSES
jgi:hypothetical protein